MSKASRLRKEAARKEPKTAVQEQPSGGPRWWWYACGLAAAILAAFILYDPAIRSPFLFDDRYLPFLQPDFAKLPLSGWVGGVRPLLMAGYWANFQVSETDPFLYHVVNVLLHAGNSILVWLIARRILTYAGVDLRQRGLLAVFAGMMFLAHPIQTESVAYVASRSESQSLVFFLGAIALFLYRRTPDIGAPEAFGVLALFGCAVMTKEHTAVLPAILLLTDYWWNPGFSFEGMKRNWKLYLPIGFGAFGALGFIAKILKGATSAGFGVKDLPWYQYFFTQCRALWVYLRMVVFPSDLNIDHDFAISRSILDHGAIIGLLALVAVTVVAWRRRREYPLASYGWFAFLILIAPTSSVVPIQDPLVDRRVYLAMFPLLLIACDLLRRVRLTPAALAGVLTITVFVYGGAAYARNLVWSDSVALWKDTAEKSPKKVRPRFQLAYSYYESGRCGDAAREYGRAAQLGKPDYALYIDWGHALDCAGDAAGALDKFRKAADLESTAHVYSLIAMVHAKRKEIPQAMEALDHADRIDPNFATTHIYRGNILLMNREFDRAGDEFRKALSLKPDDANAVNGLNLAERRVVPNIAP